MFYRIIICTLLFVFISCQSEGRNLTTPAEFKVGLILPLSGSLAEYGVAVKNSFELAKKTNPEKFSQIKLFYEDSAYQGTQAVAAFQKLVNQNKVNLIYNWGTGPNEAVIPLAEKQHIPNIVTTVDTQIVRNKNFSIRSMPSSKDFAFHLQKYFDQNNISKIGILKNELTYFNSIIAELDPKIISYTEVVPLDSNDFKSIITKVQSKEIDSLGIFLISGQIAQFYNQASNQNFKIPTFGTDFFDSQNEVNQSSDLINGAIFSSIAVTDDFRKLYIENFQNDLQIGFAGVGYDNALLIAELFNQTKNLTAEEIINKIKNIQPSPGVAGEYSFSETSESGMEIKSPAQLKIIQDRKISNYQFK